MNVIGVGMKFFEGEMFLLSVDMFCLELIVLDVVYKLIKIRLFEIVEE